ncbi:MAG TPA: hypothetical protein DCY00_06775 [Actinobacteria bacterium]|nr:hypothetical protein [Actinomycetota bacterium]
MGKSHREVIIGFKNGKNYKGTHVFSRDNILYSYGDHFILAVKQKDGTFLLNGDKYSISTSQHQSITYRVFEEYPRVSFSACSRACNNRYWYEDVKIIDYTKDIAKGAESNFEEFKKTIPVGSEIHIIKERETNKITYMSYHRIGQVLFEYFGRYFICGMDEGRYFVSELPKKARSVEEAFKILIPKAAKILISKGAGYKRQGEWFFIPVKDTEIKIPAIKVKDQLKMKALPAKESSALHTATRMIKDKNYFFVKGIIRHSTREHRSLKLGDEFHVAFKNTAIGNWSASRNVD